MEPITIGFIGIIILFIVLMLRMPIGFGMALVGFVGFWYLSNFDAAVSMIKLVPFRTFSSYDLSVIPLFVLMGELCFFSGLSKALYDTVHNWLGHLPGGLAMATVGACAGFAAISGSSMATAATMGTVALPEMKRYKYDDGLATGCVAAGGTIGILIPPSVIMIVYGVITEQSIGKLFLAGFLPGILQAILYMAVIFIICKKNPLAGPRGPQTTFIEKIVSLKETWVVAFLFVLVIGGIYGGLFSPTEAAGVGAFGAFVFALARKRLTWKSLKESLSVTGKTTAMIFTVILGAMILGYFLAKSRLPFELASMIAALPISKNAILALVLFIYLALGCIMDSMAIVLLITPIFFPLIQQLGFDPILFGILVTRVTEVGLITPPVGLNVYVIAGIAKDVPMNTIFKGIGSFLIADIVHIALLASIPAITLFLPTLMR
ncbi:MAG: TRAP transporter large permease subunit [Dehalococcoidia bacterium]|nr:TRAP transporter large permease subunit [Dehalococcoidia bacterium]